ncbi:MAG: LPS export ABC transporter periplasmic protein LptC [Longimicrobiales bacterium]
MKHLGVFLCSTLVATTACNRRTDPVSADYQNLPADQIMIGATHSPTSDGIRSAIGTYDTVYVFQDSSKLDLRGVNLQLFDATGRQTATLTARTGEMNTATEAMVARGDVQLVTLTDGRIIRTEELHYDPAGRRIWSDVATTMRHQGQDLQADGFSSDDQFKQIQFTRLRGRLPGRVSF